MDREVKGELSSDRARIDSYREESKTDRDYEDAKNNSNCDSDFQQPNGKFKEFCKASKWQENRKKYEQENDHKSRAKQNTNSKLIIVEKSPKGRFGRYEHEIGKGTFKTVYMAYDFDEGREVAWNVISTKDASESQLSQIYEEINLLKVINHPQIINYICGWYNEEKSQLNIISELFTGGSLTQYLHKIKYPRLKVIKNWAKEILKGLKYLHEQENPIIHRDIKCDNIFINSHEGVIKIGDLGFSCALKNEYASSFSGTPEFMAPEIFQSKYGVKADIYSFGMCLLEMITLEKPYKECSTLPELYEKIRCGMLPESLSTVMNEGVYDFIQLCLVKSVEERPSASELLNNVFLQDIESEENNSPVRLNTKDFEDALKEREQKQQNPEVYKNSSTCRLIEVPSKDKNLLKSEKALNKFPTYCSNHIKTLCSQDREKLKQTTDITHCQSNDFSFPSSSTSKSSMNVTNSIKNATSLTQNQKDQNEKNSPKYVLRSPDSCVKGRITLGSIKQEHKEENIRNSTSNPLHHFSYKKDQSPVVVNPFESIPKEKEKETTNKSQNYQIEDYEFNIVDCSVQEKCDSNEILGKPRNVEKPKKKAVTEKIKKSIFNLSIIGDDYVKNQTITINLIKENPLKKTKNVVTFSFNLSTDTCEEIINEIEKIDFLEISVEDSSNLSCLLNNLVLNFKRTREICQSRSSYAEEIQKQYNTDTLEEPNACQIPTPLHSEFSPFDIKKEEEIVCNDNRSTSPNDLLDFSQRMHIDSIEKQLDKLISKSIHVLGMKHDINKLPNCEHKARAMKKLELIRCFIDDLNNIK